MASSLNLNKNVPCWQNDQIFAEVIFSENFLSSESLDNGQRKSDCFSWTCSVSGNNVLSGVNEFESFILNGEKLFESFLGQNIKNFLIFNEIG